MKKYVLRRLGEEVRKRREKRGLSQRALAFKANLHVNVIGRIERGGYNPTVLTLISLSRALDASLIDLLAHAKRVTPGIVLLNHLELD
jgi:transcriptional regulator with XRE-family HTH domain